MFADVCKYNIYRNIEVLVCVSQFYIHYEEMVIHYDIQLSISNFDV